MIRRVFRSAPGALLAVALVVGISRPVAACETVPPSLAQVARQAHYIVVGQIVARPTTTDTALTLDVSRALKGSVNGTLEIHHILSSACGDGAPGIVGDTMIFARHVWFFGDDIDAYWLFDPAGVLLETSALRYKTDPPASVDSVVVSILGALPATDVASARARPGTEFGMPLALLMIGLVGAAAIGFDRRRRTRRRGSAPI